MNMSRRQFLQSGAALFSLAATSRITADRLLKAEMPDITIGMFADAHYADKDTVGERYYRDSVAKVNEAVAAFNSIKPDFIVELGDLVDGAKTADAAVNELERIESELSKFHGARHYVLGNHDMACFSKSVFFANCPAEKGYYSFEEKGFHFVVLDACCNKDESDYDTGNFDWKESYVPRAQQEWLRTDLAKTDLSVVVFIHQRLDDDKDVHCVKNAAQVRQILEDSGSVLAVFQGHDHRGAYNTVNGIHYYTFSALVNGPGLKNNAFATVEIWHKGHIAIKGFGKIKDRSI